MRVHTLHLTAFRNHADTALQPGTGITLLVGDNGQGKTNVLEAISFLSLSKSFYAANDAQAVMLGQDVLEIGAGIAHDAGREFDVRVTVRATSGDKAIRVNGSALEKLSALVGMFPAVILSPEQGGIIAGAPAERRKFLDVVLSQTSRSYLADVMEYRRVLRQRNKLLLDARLAGTPPARELPAWTDELVRLGSRLIHMRERFVDGVHTEFAETYRALAGTRGDAAVRYITADGIVHGMETAEIAGCLREAIARREAEELRRGATLAGPHRDDLAFEIDGRAAERYASQGEQKTLLIALKLSEYRFVSVRCGETPILLLDDVFAELDRHRAARVMHMLRSTAGQCIITATDEALIGEAPRWNNEHRRIIVDSGTCREASS